MNDAELEYWKDHRATMLGMAAVFIGLLLARPQLPVPAACDCALDTLGWLLDQMFVKASPLGLVAALAGGFLAEEFWSPIHRRLKNPRQLYFVLGALYGFSAMSVCLVTADAFFHVSPISALYFLAPALIVAGTILYSRWSRGRIILVSRRNGSGSDRTSPLA